MPPSVGLYDRPQSPPHSPTLNTATFSNFNTPSAGYQQQQSTPATSGFNNTGFGSQYHQSGGGAYNIHSPATPGFGHVNQNQYTSATPANGASPMPAYPYSPSLLTSPVMGSPASPGFGSWNNTTQRNFQPQPLHAASPSPFAPQITQVQVYFLKFMLGRNRGCDYAVWIPAESRTRRACDTAT